jgi:3-methyladenine DNA glycosylase AlkC
MATPLKFMYNPAYFESLCPILREGVPGFDCRHFIFRIFNNTWPDLELKQRVRHIALVLGDFLSKDFATASQQIVTISQLLRTKGRTEQNFGNIFLADYIEVFGLGHPDESLSAIEQITKLVSCEFGLRPFLLRYPKKTLDHVYRWSESSDHHVRRLSTEGCRPRLPWAMGLPAFKTDPSPLLPILEKLKQDPSEYVRRSVANHLNDIAKDHPELVISLVQKWRGKHPHTDWIIKHGCRSLFKSGNSQALALHGFNPGSQAKVPKLLLPSEVKIGQELDFRFSFINAEKKPTSFRLEYAIDYLTSTGKTSRKIFKISENLFPPGEKFTIHRKRSFKNFTTRKHFRGKHFLSIRANGKKLAGTEFMVC